MQTPRAKGSRGADGWGGIRTLETVARPHAFQACALSHSATHPRYMQTAAGEVWNSRAAATSGQGGIRTHDTVAGMPVFETGAFNHSATCPGTDSPRNAERIQTLKISLAKRASQRTDMVRRRSTTAARGAGNSSNRYTNSDTRLGQKRRSKKKPRNNSPHSSARIPA